MGSCVSDGGIGGALELAAPGVGEDLRLGGQLSVART